MVRKTERRLQYFDRLEDLVKTYPKILLVNADNVSSRQMAKIRQELRHSAELLMGKNTMIRRKLKDMIQDDPNLKNLQDQIRLNIGMIFCKDDFSKVREIVLANKLPAAAREGTFAPVDVKVPAGPTGLDTNQTSFFQALNISTKVVKSQVEIVSDVDLIQKGDKVTASHATLLRKLKIFPFSYGLEPKSVYDNGSVYDAAVLDITDDMILDKFACGVQYVAGLSRAIGMPTQASVTHSVVEAFKFCTALCIEAGDYDFPQMENLRKFVENPDAFAVAAPVAETSAAASKPQEAAKEESEEEEEDMGFSLFD